MMQSALSYNQFQTRPSFAEEAPDENLARAKSLGDSAWKQFSSMVGNVQSRPQVQAQPGSKSRNQSKPSLGKEIQGFGKDSSLNQGAEPNYEGLGNDFSKDSMVSYIRDRAQKLGIDPDIAVRVAQSEGLDANPDEAWQSNYVKNGKRERSYGPYQLYIDGGLGNDFMDQTGLDPRNPQTWPQQVDFALNHASKNGWGAWYGADRVGISNQAGIGQSISGYGS